MLVAFGGLGAGDDVSGSALSVGAADSGVVVTTTVGPYRPAMVLLPKGRFVMGSPATEPYRDDDEAQREVVIERAFYLGATEVTQSQWRALMGKNPALSATWEDVPESERGSLPVERVSWYDATEYLNRLSAKEGLEACYARESCVGDPSSGATTDLEEGDFRCSSVKFAEASCPGYRLPTEEEWEYAARAGTTGPTYAGALEVDDGGRAAVLEGIAWYAANSGGRPHVVGGKRANGWGLHDMLGNVWEWTDGKRDPGAGAVVYRGCSFADDGVAFYCRAASRFAAGPAIRVAILGFRPARSAAPSTLEPSSP